MGILLHIFASHQGDGGLFVSNYACGNGWKRWVFFPAKNLLTGMREFTNVVGDLKAIFSKKHFILNSTKLKQLNAIVYVQQDGDLIFSKVISQGGGKVYLFIKLKFYT